MEELKGAEALDAGLAASAQAVEHYEIARYGTLQEEIKADQLLTRLATTSVNKKAA